MNHDDPQGQLARLKEREFSRRVQVGRLVGVATGILMMTLAMNQPQAKQSL